MLLQGKTAVVTGGTRGIGYKVAETYLKNGAKVAILGSRQETVEKALEKLREEDPSWEAAGYWPDLSDYEEVAQTFLQIRERFGSLDILVNNAGISARESIFEYAPQDFKKIMDLNVISMQQSGCRDYEVPGRRRHSEYQLDGKSLRTACRRGLSGVQICGKRYDKESGQGTGQR